MIAYALMAARVRLADRENAALHAVADLLSTGIGLAVVGALYAQVPEIRGWTAREAVSCWGFAEASLGVFAVFFHGLYALNQRYIVGGELDRLLMRPLDPYLQVLLDSVRPQAIGVVLAGLVAIALAASMSPVAYGWWWALSPVFVVGGALIVAGFATALASIGFLHPHPGTAIGLAVQTTAYARYPADFLPAPVRWAILVVPFGFVGFVPATFYMERPEWWPLAAMQPLVGLGCFAAGQLCWRAGLRRYGSSGS